MSGYPAHRLKIMALHWLRHHFPDALLTCELAIAKYGDALLDVGAILPTEIYGIEIKGDGDNCSRLQRQGWVYSRCASRMWLLPAPSLRDAAAKHRPRGWGFIEVVDDELRGEPHGWSMDLPNAPAALVDILWKSELLTVSGELDINCKSNWLVGKIAEEVSENSRLCDLRPAVCRALLNRRWESMKPQPKRVWRPGDALPELSSIS